MGGGFLFRDPDEPQGAYWNWKLPFGAVHRPDPNADRLELDALEDDQTFARAHLALATIYQTADRLDLNGPLHLQPRPPYEPFVFRVDGLSFTLRPTLRYVPKSYWSFYQANAEAHQAERVKIRDQWHRRLDRQIASISYGWMTLGFLLAPTAWMVWVLALRTLRQRRREDGLCIECGYDLRRTHDRCPECGAAVGLSRT